MPGAGIRRLGDTWDEDEAERVFADHLGAGEAYMKVRRAVGRRRASSIVLTPDEGRRTYGTPVDAFAPEDQDEFGVGLVRRHRRYRCGPCSCRPRSTTPMQKLHRRPLVPKKTPPAADGADSDAKPAEGQEEAQPEDDD